MTDKEKVLDVYKQTIEEYADAIDKNDKYECWKKVGVLEYLGVPDIDQYIAFAYHMSGEYKKAAELFSMVDDESPHYINSIRSLIVDYELMGEYIKLDDVINLRKNDLSPLEELNARINCLKKANVDYILDNEQTISKITSRIIDPKIYEGQEAELFFRICEALASELVVAGECIHQCFLYQIRNNKPIKDFYDNDDMRFFMNIYKKSCMILEYSKCLRVFQLPEDIDSLANCALRDKEWNEKLKIFDSPQIGYVKQLMQIVLMLCRPEVHKNVDPYICIEAILSAFIHMNPRTLAQLIDNYFDIISQAYKNGVPTAAQYLGYVYSEILATNEDPFKLMERINKIRRDDDSYDINKTATSIKMVRTMSRKGYDAFMNAERTFAKTKDSVTGANDYSALSLQYFRVLEIEYCEKLIIPLAKSIDNNKMKQLVNECSGDTFRKWNTDFKFLKKISENGQSSIEMGAVRTLLAHVIGYYTREDACAKYLMEFINCSLTDEGKKALIQKKMLDVINNASLEKYRIPGAHTGYLPYSEAIKAKRYVCDFLPIIETWFK